MPQKLQFEIKVLNKRISERDRVIRQHAAARKAQEKLIVVLRQAMLEQAQTVTKLRNDIACKDKVIEIFNTKNQFICHPGRETMHVRIGSKEMKWMPSPIQYAVATKHIKDSRLDERYNILLTNAFTDTQII
jgi:hypothetical protein